MYNYISYHEVECFICKKSFSRQLVGRKPQVELALNRNQYCKDCWEKEQSKKIPIINLAKTTGFVVIKIYNAFSIKAILKENGYSFDRDVKGNAYWQKILQVESLEESFNSIQNLAKKSSPLKKFNKELKKLLTLEKKFFQTKLFNVWQLNDDPETQKLFSLDLS